MPWIEKTFNEQADSNGLFNLEQTLAASLGGKLKGFKIQTTTGCNGRIHQTTLTVARVDDSSDKLEIGPVRVTDCTEAGGTIEPPFRLRGSKQYRISFNSGGFNANELVNFISMMDVDLFEE